MNKQKQALFILIFAILSWADVSAQQILEDVVYLNNGSIIRGKIINNENDTLKIETCGRNLLVFKSTEIQNKTQEIKRVSKQEFIEGFVPIDQKGIYSYSTLGFLIGKSTASSPETFSAQTSVGYNFNNYIGLGLGIGIEKLQTEIIPVFVSFKSNLAERANAPFFSCHIGYSFPLSKEKKSSDAYNNYDYQYQGGINAGFDLGILTYKSQNRAFTITAGYRYQLVKETYTTYYWSQNSIENNTYEFNKISVKIGFMFM